ncbi:MAG TPA: ketoacyl-ACP synthase III [Candidatus Eisenbacteria bacterium]|nr:ketoacyl-ACP synthase III [Candidatus Eisenbacteria bacterium]
MTVFLHGLGHFHPENEITNDFLEGLDLGTTDAWIMERVGIRSRRTTLPLDYIRSTRNRDPRGAQEATLYTHADAGRRAAEMALGRAGIGAADIGLVIAGSSVMDTATPAEACNIAHALGIEAPALDVNSACTSFFAQLHLLSLMRPDALPPFVLLVVAEAVTRAVDYTDRASAVLWGDGTIAAVVSTTVPGRASIVESTLVSSPEGAERVVVPRTGHFRQDGRVVQMFAIKKTAQLLRHLQDAYRQEGRRFRFVGHQANLRMLEAVCRQCDIPDDRHHANVEWFGNTAGAGAPSVLSMRWDDWSADDDVAVVGVGAGLTWSSYLLRFGAAA